MDEKEATLASQILLQMTEDHLMPFEGFCTVAGLAMSLEILLDRSFNGQVLTFFS
jgi:hypothetical protein